jgi:2-oxo-4-hydroxy-4-carboxy-5-ureidoimidazoline decarboxylase
MLLEHFNTAIRSEVISILRTCLDISRWAGDIADARPYPSSEKLLAAAAAAAEPFTEQEIDTALAHHPRIGERAAGTSAEAAMSAAEQAGLGAADAAVAAALADGNLAYEEKFGRVFLIRAAGRTGADILSRLQARMDNTPEAEMPIIAAQLREIAALRLKGVMSA